MNSRKLASIAIKKGAAQKITELSPLINLLKKRKLGTVVEIGFINISSRFLWYNFKKK